MFPLVFVVVRYLFLLLLFVFLFSLVRWMVGDLQAVRELTGRRRSSFVTHPPLEERTAGAHIIVLETASSVLAPGDTFVLGKGVVIGRGGGSDIAVGDTYASARHARIFLRNGQYWLEDLGSKNGTFLNEVKVGRPAVLADGDRIRIGGTIFQFVRWGV